jgi:hypothetical protein
MEQVYRIDVNIAGTAYVKATDAKSALAKAKVLAGSALEVAVGRVGDVDVSDVAILDAKAKPNPDLPEVSLSPMMTVLSVDDQAEEV